MKKTIIVFFVECLMLSILEIIAIQSLLTKQTKLISPLPTMQEAKSLTKTTRIEKIFHMQDTMLVKVNGSALLR